MEKIITLIVLCVAVLLKCTVAGELSFLSIIILAVIGTAVLMWIIGYADALREKWRKRRVRK